MVRHLSNRPIATQAFSSHPTNHMLSLRWCVACITDGQKDRWRTESTANASRAFGTLARLSSGTVISPCNKTESKSSQMLSVVLYGSEYWTTSYKHLNAFHHQCINCTHIHTSNLTSQEHHFYDVSIQLQMVSSLTSECMHINSSS